MISCGTLYRHAPFVNGWQLWRTVELRSAGFAARWVDGLADVELAHAIDATPSPGAPASTTAFGSALTDAQSKASELLRSLAREPAFREAVTWQNRRVLHSGIGPLLRAPDGRTNSKHRQKEQLVASYAQRYCCKNERAGFFGASTPAQLADDGPALTVRPGAGLISERSAYLEPWAIEALADQLAMDPELSPELCPRRMPTVRLEDTTLIHSGGKRSPLPVAYARLIAACDGETPAHRIAEALVAEPALELGSVDEVYEMLVELATERVVIWTLEVPTTGGPPERLLRAQLERIAPCPARDRAVAALDALEQARDRLAAAAGSPEGVDEAIDALEQTFVAVTGQDSVRNHGEAYAGRTIVGEDCVRDVEVTIGPPVVQRLAGPLGLVLQSARWFTYEIAARYRVAIDEVYRELRGDGPPEVDYARFYARLPELFPAGNPGGSIIAHVADELHARWRSVLGVEGPERRIERTAEALQPAVARVFAAPCPGWPAARHHSPDVLIAADGVDAVNRGDFLAVLGEIHVGMNSLLVPYVPNPERDPDAPFALRDRDLGRPCVAPVWSRRRSRLDYYSRSPGDYDVELTTARSWRPRAQVLALADLVLEQTDAGLVVRTRDGRVVFDVIAFLEHHLLGASFSAFGFLSGSHTPRVTVDGVVLVREKWGMPASELTFAHASDPTQRFIQARTWARDAGVPRRVFLKVPEETKPMYVDLASPTYVELAAKIVRKASRVSISEMLPDLDNLWLIDREHNRYTSEFRFVAVDPEPWAKGLT